LRERKEDIPGLADYFLIQYAVKYGKPSLKMSTIAYDTLIKYYWPGNIRELKHTIEKAVILCDSSVLKPDDLNLKAGLKASPKERITPKEEEESNCSLSDIEKDAIAKVLEKCQGNVSKAAKILDISRTTLYTKMKDYKL
jgi:DNA-binding NtrC family response regulator